MHSNLSHTEESPLLVHRDSETTVIWGVSMLLSSHSGCYKSKHMRKHQAREGWCLPARCRQLIQTPLHCQPRWVPWRVKKTKKREFSESELLHDRASPTAGWSTWCQFSLARLQSSPCAPGDQSEAEHACSYAEKDKNSVRRPGKWSITGCGMKGFLGRR